MQSCFCELTLASLPRLMKTCPRCKCAVYENSGCFRVNANGKRLDIWLICRCEHCKTIWNLSVYERVDRAALDDADLSGYFANDASLAFRHIFDPAFLQKNRAVLDLDHIDIICHGTIPPEGSAVQIHLTCAYPLPVPAGRAIALTLGVSLSRVKKMQQCGMLQFNGDLRKTKTDFGFSFILALNWQRNA